MFYKTKVSDYVRVLPESLNQDKEERVRNEIKRKYESFIDKDLGIVVDVSDVEDIGEGRIIAGDASIHYKCVFTLITFKPENQEVIQGKIKDITDFGAFITMGPVDGMIHVSQTMNDFVSFSKDKVLNGKETNQNLKVGDTCNARVIAISYKDPSNPKIGLTMRQEFLGRPEWWVKE